MAARSRFLEQFITRTIGGQGSTVAAQAAAAQRAPHATAATLQRWCCDGIAGGEACLGRRLERVETYTLTE